MPNIGRDAIPFVNVAGFVPSTTAGVGTQVTEEFFAPVGTLKSSVLITGDAGSPQTQDITIGGAYVTGDEVRVTVVSNDSSRQLWRKSYSYVVQPGDTNDDIAAALSAQIAADGTFPEAPVSASVVANVVTVTAKSGLKNAFVMYEYTDSAAGTIVLGAVAYTPEVGTPDYLRSLGVPEDQIVLPLYDIVRIDYEAIVAVPFIDSKGAKEIELYIACDPAAVSAQANALVALIPN